MDPELTITELARAVGKPEGYVRQHVHRGHLPVQKQGRQVTVRLEDAARWAEERGLSFDRPGVASLTALASPESRVARVTVLVLDPGDAEGPSKNLFTLVRHRRRDAVGPWAREPNATWSSHDVGRGLRLYTLDTTYEGSEQLVQGILDSGILTIDGIDVEYQLGSVPRRHWAYRDLTAQELSIRSPFGSHSAEIIEYWCFDPELRERWFETLRTLEPEEPELAHLGFPLFHRSDRVGNLVIAGAADALTCDIHAQRDKTLRFTVDAAEPLLPGAYRATVWASHSGDEVLRREIPVTLGHTTIDVGSDVDRIGFAVHRAEDGECVDLMDAHLLLEIRTRMELQHGPAIDLQNGRGKTIHRVQPAGIRSTTSVRFDQDSAQRDKLIRRFWLDRNLHESEARSRRERRVVRFQPDQFPDAIRHMVRCLVEHDDDKKPIYIADPYFMHPFEGDTTAKFKALLDILAATNGRRLRVLCAKTGDTATSPPSWWFDIPVSLRAHVEARTFIKKTADGKERRGFHDRYFITSTQEVLMTHSINGWHDGGVTFDNIPYGTYRSDAERLWNMDIDSPSTPLLVKLVAP